MEYKVMTEAQRKEIDELLNSEHNEALWAFGWECAEQAVDSFKKGMTQGCKRGLIEVTLVSAAAAATVIVIHAVSDKVKQKKLERQKNTEE